MYHMLLPVVIITKVKHYFRTNRQLSQDYNVKNAFGVCVFDDSVPQGPATLLWLLLAVGLTPGFQRPPDLQDRLNGETAPPVSFLAECVAPLHGTIAKLDAPCIDTLKTKGS